MCGCTKKSSPNQKQLVVKNNVSKSFQNEIKGLPNKVTQVIRKPLPSVNNGFRIR